MTQKSNDNSNNGGGKSKNSIQSCNCNDNSNGYGGNSKSSNSDRFSIKSSNNLERFNTKSNSCCNSNRNSNGFDSKSSNSQKTEGCLNTETYLITITGIVQGVGFRPFIWLAAEKLKLSGSVANTTGGVIIKINSAGEAAVLQFTEYIKKNKPAAALIESIRHSRILFEEFSGFNIEKSYRIENSFTLVSPDIATCDKCIRDINDNKNSRRYNYPFTNCTNCGPRFTIIGKMPYDRPNTTMKKFIQCPECNAEYIDPRDRRFHAQPNACSICGPVLKLLDSKGETVKTSDPVAAAAKLLRQGLIIGIKSLGGFQLACDASNVAAVAKLRKRKARPAKLFALMFKDTTLISELYDSNITEKESLNSPAAPIVLLKKKAPQHISQLSENNKKNSVSSGVSFHNKYDGVMLPYTPLHHLLFNHINFPLVMTSGNISEEPIAFKNSEALSRLGGICDYFLLNNRDIFSRYDDSVIRIFDNKEMIVRRARGYAPYPVTTDTDIGNKVILAVGAQEKNTFCLYTSNYALVSQHIGDLDNLPSRDFFTQTLKNYKQIFGIKKIDIVISDKHPDYISTKFAKEHLKSAKKIQIQHHEAHIASVIAENRLFEGLTAAVTASECENPETLATAAAATATAAATECEYSEGWATSASKYENSKALDTTDSECENPEGWPVSVAASSSECENPVNTIFEKKTKNFSLTAIDANLSGKNSPVAEMILGFSWDGTGYGNDGKIWGSEIFTVDTSFNFNRMGSLREKCLPGGEITIKKPYRMAFSYLYENWKANNPKNEPGSFVDYIFKNFPFYKDISSENEVTLLESQIETGFNSVVTTSMGRFFDAVSSILDISHIVSYEGEAAIKLEMAADLHCEQQYDLQYLSKPGFYDNETFVLDDYHILMQILKDIGNKVEAPFISAKFHNSLAGAILLISLGAREKYGIDNIALGGGVFQNNFLLAKSFELLKKQGFKPYTNFKVPVNDGGISLGQAYYAAWKIKNK